MERAIHSLYKKKPITQMARKQRLEVPKRVRLRVYRIGT